jgi:hypothetical protein
LNGCYGARTYDVTITGCPVITLRPTSLPDAAVGASYSQSVVADFGTPPITFAVTSGALPGGISLSSSGLFSGVPTAEGSSTFTITSSDADGCSGSREYNILVAPRCLFCDDFNDGVLDPNWTYAKPAWSERDGTLIATPAGKKTLAIAEPVFASGCSNCTVDVRLMTAGGTLNKVWVLGWYENKRNAVELLVNEESNRLILKQRAGNRVVAKAKAAIDLKPNQFYTLRLSFDGSEFRVLIDGSSVIQMPKAPGTSPLGTVGFQVKNTTATFDYITVNQ